MIDWNITMKLAMPIVAASQSSPTRGACEAASILGLSLERAENNRCVARDSIGARCESSCPQRADYLTWSPKRKRGACSPERDRATTTQSIDIPVRSGRVTLLSGPSGAGKSTLLRRVTAALRHDGVAVVEVGSVRLRRGACVEQFGGSTLAAMRALARAGLAEAGCMVRRPSELSEGERARLHLALAMHRAERLASRGVRVALACDEFTSNLDALTARSVAHLLGRWARGTTGVAVLSAGTRESLRDWTGATHELALALDGSARVLNHPDAPAPEPGITIEEADRSTLEQLEHLHYRAARPATLVKVLAARDGETGELLGVLGVSMPVLNSGWRDVAWPGRYTTGSKRDRAARLNNEVRCISRVIVDPRARGTGVARRLVRAYLASPLTVRTEAVASMALACPFFERAGMRRIDLGVSDRNARLRDALRYAGLEPWRLAMPSAALARAIETRGEEFVRTEVRRWAASSRADERRKDRDLRDLFARACASACAEAAAFVHEDQRSEGDD